MVIPNNFTIVSVLIILLAILTSKPLLLLLSFVKIIEWNFSGFAIILFSFNHLIAVFDSSSRREIRFEIEFEKLESVLSSA